MPLALLLACSLALVSPARSFGQAFGRSIPAQGYFRGFIPFHDGDYTNALDVFRDELKGSIKIGQARYIDSICDYAMCGECYYQMGQLNEALEHYNAALDLWMAYSEWLLRVQMPAIASVTGQRSVVPWGQSRRNTRLGQFPNQMNMLFGNIPNAQAAQAAGLTNPMLSMIPVNVQEVIRCTALSIRRRRELLGPLCQHDAFTKRLVSAASKTLVPPSSWAQPWANVQVALILASDGQGKAASDMLQQSLLVMQQFDHPLTATALVEIGHLAHEAGDLNTAAQAFEEASYSAFDYGDIGVIEESLRFGHLIHLVTGQQGPYPPLLKAINWARSRNYRHLQTSLTLLMAETYAIYGQTPQAAGLLGDARTIIGRRTMGSGEIGGYLNYVTAFVNYQKGNVKGGDEALGAAIDFKRTASRWLFQLNLADQRANNGHVTPRQASGYFEFLLREPTAIDWATDPLDVLTVLTTPHSLPYERWFEIMMDRKDTDAALDIAERARRHRFFTTLHGGGRLLALRWLLEGPEEALDGAARLQRQELLTRYTGYAKLSKQAQEIRDALARKSLVPDSVDEQRQHAELLASLTKVSLQQETALREIAVRREPSEFIFPPLVKTRDLRAKLPEGQIVLTFFATTNKTYAFLLSSQKYATWTIASPQQVERHLTALLRELGNYDQNREMSLQELSGETWKKASGELYDALVADSEVNLGDGIQELVIIPDSLLWYLPFEALQVPQLNGGERRALLSQTRIRYAPTMGLAISNEAVRQRTNTAAVVVGKLFPRDDAGVAQAAFEQLKRAVPEAVVLKQPLPGASSVYRVEMDGLIVLDDLPTGEKGPYDWTPIPLDRAKGANNTASMWMTLPWGGPDYLILPGFHTPAENGLNAQKRTGNGVPGNEMFLALCGLMVNGADTILISRWRTGGQTSFDLVREFVQELPHSTAADAWQRSVLLVADQVLNPDQEPRIKRNRAIPPPKAQHPYFWSGYLLVDLGATPHKPDKAEKADKAAAAN